MRITELDLWIIRTLRRSAVPVARGSLFIVFFWFGLIKILDVSPASPLAFELTKNTIGLQYFEPLFFAIALLECIVGILFLIPRATRVVIPLLFFHMAIVCAPLFLVPSMTWQSLLVPSLEGQYIIKNAVVIALAIGLAAQINPVRNNSLKRANKRAKLGS